MIYPVFTASMMYQLCAVIVRAYDTHILCISFIGDMTDVMMVFLDVEENIVRLP